MPSPANTPGNVARTLFVDSIDEAMERTRIHGRDHSATARRPKRQLVDVGIRQLRAAEKLQRMMSKQIEAMRAAGQTPDEKFIFAFNALTTSITKTMEQIRRSRKAELDALGGLADGQLDDVLRVHLPRLAQGMVAADRRLMLEIWFGGEVATVLMRDRETAVTAGRVVVDGDPSAVPL